MGKDPEAKLFYGFLEPLVEDDEESEDEDGEEDETPWEKAHTRKAYGCIGGIYGYDENLGHFLAVEASLKEAEWDEVMPLTSQDFEVKPGWNQQLKEAALVQNIDLTGLTPGWFLVSLWF
jgi:hypothetical protein